MSGNKKAVLVVTAWYAGVVYTHATGQLNWSWWIYGFVFYMAIAGVVGDLLGRLIVLFFKLLPDPKKK